jgi:hypothetical protein
MGTRPNASCIAKRPGTTPGVAVAPRPM